jgi:hypothetical protein
LIFEDDGYCVSTECSLRCTENEERSSLQASLGHFPRPSRLLSAIPIATATTRQRSHGWPRWCTRPTITPQDTPLKGCEIRHEDRGIETTPTTAASKWKRSGQYPSRGRLIPAPALTPEAATQHHYGVLVLDRHPLAPMITVVEPHRRWMGKKHRGKNNTNVPLDE